MFSVKDEPPAVSEGVETTGEQASDTEDEGPAAFCPSPTRERCPQSSVKTAEAKHETPAFQFRRVLVPLHTQLQ